MPICSRIYKDKDGKEIHCTNEAEMFGGYCPICKDEVFGVGTQTKKQAVTISYFQQKLLEWGREKRNKHKHEDEDPSLS